VLSSPGVIPYEYTDFYPFNKYDWPEWEETPEVKEKYIEVTQKRVENYLKTHAYKKYFCYMKLDSESYIALKQACKKLKIELVNCLDEETYDKIKTEKNPLTFPSALEDLKNILTKSGLNEK
jgi:predicted RNA-binding protein